MKRTKRFLCMTLAVILGVVFNPVRAVAAEEKVAMMYVTQQEGLTLNLDDADVYGGLYDSTGNSQARVIMLTNCAIRMTYETASLYMEFVSGCNAEASELGVKDIKVQEKNGIFWNTIATSSGGSIANATSFVGNCTCTSVVKGETYRVKCVHYAYINGTYYSLENVTDGHKFN